ncbi:hypothetical protein J6A31_04275 [bacterium]|nr:hypothetical protein [bacterium]
MMEIRFQKYNSQSFQAHYKSPFSKQFEKVLHTGEGQNELIANFKKLFPEKKTAKNRIGLGAYGSVFRIDDYYVFKVYHNQKPELNGFKKNENNKFDDLKTYSGKVLARIGNVEIIKNVTRDKNKFVEMAKPIDNGIPRYLKTLKEFASLPQKAFDTLAKDFQKLNEIKNPNLFYRFDTNNPNNFIKVGDKIKIVDDIDWVPTEEPNDLFNLLRIFIHKEGESDYKKEIFKKCILASEKANLPMEAAHKYLKKFMDEICQFAYSKKTFNEIFERLTDLRKNIPDETSRLKEVKNFIEEL